MDTDTDPAAERDAKTGQFLKGYRGGPGRKVGSRNLLTTQFLDDLYTEWLKRGVYSLERLSHSELVKAVNAVLVKQVQTTLSADDNALELMAAAANHAEAVRKLAEYVGSRLTVDATPAIELEAEDDV